MNFSSPWSTRLALGPGRAVLIFGPAVAVKVLVVIEVPPLLGRARLSRAVRPQFLSGFSTLGVRQTGPVVWDSHAALVQARTGQAIRRRQRLIATEEAGTQTRRQIGPIAPRTHEAPQ